MTDTHRILLTGSQGFVGKNVQEYFENFSSITLHCPNEAELDLTDSYAVMSCMHKFEPTLIVHAATGNISGKSYSSNVCEHNLRMYFNLLRHRSSDCILYSLCSGSSYDRNNWMENMPEDYLGKHIPTDSQGFSKFVISSHAATARNVVILRLFGIFGKYEDYRNKFISNTIAKRLMNVDITLAKNARYDYLDVIDFCHILHQLIQLNVSTGVFNVTPDQSTTLSNIINTVDQVMRVDCGHKVLEEGWGKPYTGMNERLRSILPRFEFTTLETSIHNLIQFYRVNKHVLDRHELERDSFLEYAKSINGK